MTSSTLVVRRDHRDYEILMVVAGFLAGYTGNTSCLISTISECLIRGVVFNNSAFWR